MPKVDGGVEFGAPFEAERWRRGEKGGSKLYGTEELKINILN
jgi:hypothetical protein